MSHNLLPLQPAGMKTIPTAILELFAEGSKIIMWMELDISYRDLKNNPIVETIIWGYINPMKKYL